MRVLVETLYLNKGEHVPFEWERILNHIDKGFVDDEEGPEEWKTDAAEQMTVVVTVYAGD